MPVSLEAERMLSLAFFVPNVGVLIHPSGIPYRCPTCGGLYDFRVPFQFDPARWTVPSPASGATGIRSDSRRSLSQSPWAKAIRRWSGRRLAAGLPSSANISIRAVHSRTAVPLLITAWLKSARCNRSRRRLIRECRSLHGGLCGPGRDQGTYFYTRVCFRPQTETDRGLWCGTCPDPWFTH